MMHLLSIAAGSFAVIGIVDVVLRATCESYRLISDIKDAPKELKQLQTCINENTSLLGIFKRYLEEFKNYTSSTIITTSGVDISPAIAQFTSATRCFDRELHSRVSSTN
jgi:hypothetical protein